MTSNEQRWWEPEAWNSQTINLFTVGNPVPDENFINITFRTLEESEYVPFRPSSQLPGAQFLNAAYDTLGLPLTAEGGKKPYLNEDWGVAGSSAYDHWELYYSLLGQDPRRLDLYSSQRDHSPVASRLCRSRVLNYLNATEWTADEAFKIANLIARRQLGGRFPELGDQPLAKTAYLFNDTNTNQHLIWQAFLRNPYLPGLGKPTGQDETVWESLVGQIMHVSTQTRKESNKMKLLPYLVSNPSIPLDLLEECRVLIEKSHLSNVEKTATFRRFGRNRKFDDHTEKHMKQLGEKICKTDLSKLVAQIRAGGYFVNSGWAATGLVCAERPETEPFAREIISAAFDASNWELLSCLAPMVGKVIADQEMLLGVEPNTVPPDWLMATA